MFFREIRVGSALGDRSGMLADATAFDEDLRLQELVLLSHFALDVLDGTVALHFRVEAENHLGIRDNQIAFQPLKT